jgi:hypothetical protein
LPINIINEKIYVILWMWFMLLFLLTAGYFTFHLLLIASARLRYAKLRFQAPSCNGRQLRHMVRSRGHWFVLEFVALNLKPNSCKELLNALFDEFFDSHGRPRVEQSMLSKYRDLLANNPSAHAFVSKTMKHQSSNNMHHTRSRQMANVPMMTEAPSALNCVPSAPYEGFAAIALGGVKGSNGSAAATAALNASFNKKTKKTTKARPVGFTSNATSGSALRQLLSQSQGQAMLDDEWPEVNEHSELLQQSSAGRRSPDSWQLALNENDEWPTKGKNRRPNNVEDAIDSRDYSFLFEERRGESQQEVESLLSKKKALRSALGKGKQKHLARAASDIGLDDD